VPIKYFLTDTTGDDKYCFIILLFPSIVQKRSQSEKEVSRLGKGDFQIKSL